MTQQAAPLNFENILGLDGVDSVVQKPKTTQVLDSFSLDKELYAEIYKDSEDIQNAVAEGQEYIRTYADFSQDLYMGLFKQKPKLIDKEDVKKTHQFNHELMERIMETDEFRDLRRKTRLDFDASAIGLQGMSEKAVEIIKEYIEESQNQGGGSDPNSPFQDLNDHMDQNQPGGTGAPGSGNPQQNQGPSQGQGGGGSGQGQTPQQGQGQPDAPDMPGPAPQMNNQLLDDAVDKLKAAMRDAADDVGETKDFLEAWGMDGGDPNRRVSFEEKRYALEKLRTSHKLRKLTDIVGRMKKLAINEKKEKDTEGPQSIKDVKHGDNIQSVLPSDMMLFGSDDEDLENLFLQKYADRQLLEYDKESFQTKGRGPMIVCVDTSGSMDGEREHWAKAVALGLLEVAGKQKRNYACIHFDSYVQGVWEIPHGTLKPEAIFQIAEQFSCGGTNFYEPLNKSLEIMEKSEFEKGDIVFITDGHSGLDDEFLQRFNKTKAEKRFSVHTVVINMGGSASSRTINSFSDRVIQVSNLAALEEQNSGAIDIFQGVQ